MTLNFLGKIKEVFLYHILHTDDTPHRIALGAATGIFIACTPTFGIQMVLAVALAALLRANKAVAIPMVWLTNPFTNVPIYGFAYAFGHFLLTGTWKMDSRVIQGLDSLMNSTLHFQFYQSSYWSELFNLLMKISLDLWVGCTILGILCALVTYPITYWFVIKYRKVKKIIQSHKAIKKNEPLKSESEAKAETEETQNTHHAA